MVQLNISPWTSLMFAALKTFKLYGGSNTRIIYEFYSIHAHSFVEETISKNYVYYQHRFYPPCSKSKSYLMLIKT